MTNNVRVVGNKNRTPLEPTDFGTFEVTPDGVLYKDEFTPEGLECFVWRYLYTASESSRKAFRGAMENALMEDVRARLIKLNENGHVPDELKARYDFIMDNEFKEKDWRFSSEAGTNVNRGFNEMEAQNGDRIRETRITLDTYVYASALRLFVFSDRKLTLSFTPVAGPTFQYHKISMGEEEISNEYDFGGAKLSGSANYFARDDSWKLNTNGYYASNFGDIAPDFGTHSAFAAFSGERRQMFGKPLSLEGSLSWNTNRYEKPANPNYNTRNNDGVSGTGQFSYQDMDWKAGALLRLSGSMSSGVDYFSESDSWSTNASLLAQRKSGSEGYFRAGGGGGFWSSDFQRSDTGESGASSGSEIHVLTELKFRPEDWPELTLNGAAQLNRSDGTFEGWYPSWSASTGVAFNLLNNELRLNLGLSHTGSHIDLNLERDTRSWSSNAGAEYRPNDNLKLGFNIAAGISEIDGYAEENSREGSTSAFTAYRFLNDGNWWLYGSMFYNVSEWKNTQAIDTQGLGGSLSVSCSY